MRRLVAIALVLLAFAPAASAKRRAVTPLRPSACALGTLLPATYANVLASDGEFIYLIDEMATLARVPKAGGARQDLAEPLDGWLAFAMEVDATHVYISALPFEAIFAPVPGAILSVPKDGGVISVLASGVETAMALAVDDQYVYWAAAGILDFSAGELRPGGKIERMNKDGSGRIVLADDLSAPLGIALDGTNVYFGESGLAAGDSTVGLHRVPKSGGAVTTIDANTLVAGLALAGNDLVFVGATEAAGFGLFRVGTQSPGEPQPLVTSESVSFAVRVADRRAYMLVEGESAVELVAVDIDVPGELQTIRSDIDGDAFVLDGCAAVVNTIDGDLIRTAR